MPNTNLNDLQMAVHQTTIAHRAVQETEDTEARMSQLTSIKEVIEALKPKILAAAEALDDRTLTTIQTIPIWSRFKKTVDLHTPNLQDTVWELVGFDYEDLSEPMAKVKVHGPGSTGTVHLMDPSTAVILIQE